VLPNGKRHRPSGPMDLFGELHACIERIRVAGRVTPRAADEIASYGELVSSAILALAIGSGEDREAAGALEAPWIDCRQILITDDSFTRAQPIYEETEPRMRDALLPHMRAGRIPVLGGYVGSTREGITTTLGKEGSDFSAAIVGAALGADEVQIWTDVDGMMTADPRVVPLARRIRTLSFNESLELACSGAKKPHYGTIGPAKRAGVPIRILSSLHPSSDAGEGTSEGSEGTLIGRRCQSAPPGIKSIAWRPSSHHITVWATRRGADILPEVCEVCERFRPSLIVVRVGERAGEQPGEQDIELALERVDRLLEVRQALARFAELRIDRGRAVVSLVSEDLETSDELVRRTMEAAGAHDPRLVMDGVAAACVRCLVDDTDETEAEKIVAMLHERVFPGPPGEPIE